MACNTENRVNKKKDIYEEKIEKSIYYCCCGI